VRDRAIPLVLTLVVVVLVATTAVTAAGGTERVDSQSTVGTAFETAEDRQMGSHSSVENESGGRDRGQSADGHSGVAEQKGTGEDAPVAKQQTDPSVSAPPDERRPGVPYSVTRPLDTIRTFEQPNGVRFEGTFWTAGVTAGWRTDAGYTVLQGEDGYWYYAANGEGRLVPSDARVGIDRVPAAIPTGLVPSVGTDLASVGTDEIPSTGNQSIPAVMVNFSDTSTSYSPPEFQSLLFGDDPDIATGPGSVTDYYEEASYGQLTLTGDVEGWETADNGESYYGGGGIGDGGSPTGAAELVKEAAQKADSQVDFAGYDNDGDCVVDQFAAIHQGGGQEVTGQTEDIWSHRWYLSAGTDSAYATDDSSAGCSTIYVNGYTIQPETYNGQIATIGVYAHEFGHGLGLPDLYDTDGSSEGIGNWGLMGSGSYGTVTRPGDAPNHLTAWSKSSLGWLDPLEITTGEAQSVTLEDVSTDSDYLKLLDEANNTNGEYFYVENRQTVGFDQGLPGEGLLVSHVNESRLADDCVFSNSCNDDENNKLVDIEAADGNEDMDERLNRGDEGDPWDESASPFDDSSTPSSDYDNGSSSNATVSSVQFADGTAQGTATLDAAVSGPANLAVNLTGTNAPVFEGNTLSANVTVENTGDTEGTRTITLDSGSLGSSSTSLTLGPGESTLLTLTVATSNGDAGNYTATVGSGDDSDSTTVTVLAPVESNVSALSIVGQGTEATITAGDNGNASVVVENAGGQSESFDVTLEIGAAVNRSQTTSELAAGETETAVFESATGELDNGTYTVTVSTADDTVDGTLTVESPTTGLVFSSQNVTESEDVVVGDVSSGGVESLLLVTYEKDGEDTVAGVANGTFGGENVTVTLDEFVGFPATYTAHLVPVDNASGPYAPGDALSAATASAALVNTSTNVTTSTGAPMVTVGEGPAKDTTGDGLLNDVVGTGSFNIFDMQALFDNKEYLNSEGLAEFFNFQGSNPDEVTIFDVQALFDIYQEAT